MVLLLHSPKRGQSEPGKRQSKANRNSDPAGGRAPGFVPHVFADKGQDAEGRNRQEQCPGDLEPELPEGVTKRAQRRAHSAHDGVERAAAPSLLPGDPRHYSELLPGRNFAHALDFNSLRRYNDGTAVSGEPFRRRRHPNY